MTLTYLGSRAADLVEYKDKLPTICLRERLGRKVSPALPGSELLMWMTGSLVTPSGPNTSSCLCEFPARQKRLEWELQALPIVHLQDS